LVLPDLPAALILKRLRLKRSGIPLLDDDAYDAPVRGCDQERGCECRRRESPMHEDILPHTGYDFGGSGAGLERN
jgi:hypothetical protein